MNVYQSIILSVIRSLLMAGGAVAVHHGLVSSNDVPIIAGAVIDAGTLAWGAWDKVRAEREAQRRESVAAVDAAIETANAPRTVVFSDSQRVDFAGGSSGGGG